MKNTTMKTKSKCAPVKKRYTPKPAPANSFVTSVSPLSNTERVRVQRWHDFHGTPTLFLVVDKNGRELRRFEYEPHALAHCEALDLELSKFELYTVSDAP
jgi:hypothetical protein